MTDAKAPQSLTLSELQTAEKVATEFRKVVVWFGLTQLGGIAAQVLPAAATGAAGSGAGPPPLTVALALIALLGVLACLAMLVGHAYLLMSALGSSAAWAWCLGMFVPCVSLLVLVIMNSQATAWCKARGIAVGLLGPTPQALAEIRASIVQQGAAPDLSAFSPSALAASAPGSFVRSCRAAGHTDEQIVAMLVQGGWQQDDAEQLVALTPA